MDAGLSGGPLAFVAGDSPARAPVAHLSGTGRIGSIARVLAMLGLLGIIYGFLSPDFGLNPQSLVLFVSLVIGLGFITFYSEGSASRLANRAVPGERVDQAVRDGGHRRDPGGHHLALDRRSSRASSTGSSPRR